MRSSVILVSWTSHRIVWIVERHRRLTCPVKPSPVLHKFTPLYSLRGPNTGVARQRGLRGRKRKREGSSSAHPCRPGRGSAGGEARIVPSSRGLGLAAGRRAGWPGLFGSAFGVVAVAVAVGGLCRMDRKSQMNLRSDRTRCLKFRCVDGGRNDCSGSGGATSSLVALDSHQSSPLSLSLSLGGRECMVVRHCRRSYRHCFCPPGAEITRLGHWGWGSLASCLLLLRCSRVRSRWKRMIWKQKRKRKEWMATHMHAVRARGTPMGADCTSTRWVCLRMGMHPEGLLLDGGWRRGGISCWRAGPVEYRKTVQLQS
jgi:hypothetical protein